MGQGLSGGKPFLVQGEGLPTVGLDVPGHPAGHLVGGEAGLPLDDGQGLPHPVPVVGEEGLDPRLQIPGVPVAGEGQLHREGPDLLQTLQVPAQGVGHIGPHGNVGGDVKEDVVGGEQNPRRLQPQAQLPRGVAGGGDDLEGVVPHGEDLPVLYHAVVGQVQGGT